MEEENSKRLRAFPFGGVIAMVIGLIICIAATSKGENLWLIGSIPLTIFGIVLIFIQLRQSKIL